MYLFIHLTLFKLRVLQSTFEDEPLIIRMLLLKYIATYSSHTTIKCHNYVNIDILLSCKSLASRIFLLRFHLGYSSVKNLQPTSHSLSHSHV